MDRSLPHSAANTRPLSEAIKKSTIILGDTGLFSMPEIERYE
jgi:hypothetical protein